MLIELLILLSGMIVMLLLLRFYRSLKVKTIGKPICDFKFSSIKYKKRGEKQYALFDVHVPDRHTFFVDFPVLFRFYSDHRFKSKIKINYKSSTKGKREEIVNKTIIFETKTQESIHYINDIIVGEIFFEIETNIDYGSPMLEFSILENSLCKLGKEYKIEIIFPNK
jgi:hypothetical protein